MAANSRLLEHLVREYSEPVKDPVWRNISLCPSLLRVVGLPAFQKLHGIRQLGPTYLVYPGATHTRLNHSLGVFHLARRMMMQLIRAAERPSLSLEGVKAFLCAALLHDLGHYPFVHSLKDLPVASHESLTSRYILGKDFSRILRGQVGTDPELVAAIIDPSLSYRGGEELRFFRNLLSGVLDPDKLDYLNRDAYFCGVPHGVQDVDFVLEEIRPLSDALAVSRKGLTAVESILFSKYLMYRSVYWHKTVRIATAMIKKAVLLGLEQCVLVPERLYGLDDQEFYALTSSIPFAPLQLVSRVAQRRLYKLVARVPFQEENELHRRLVDLRYRLAFEEDLASEAGKKLGRRLAPESIIVDIPEPIAFEIDLPVLEEGERVPYPQSGSVFSPETVKGFVGSLRSLSLLAEEELVQALQAMGGRRILEVGLEGRQ